jgi:hypothetical protein
LGARHEILERMMRTIVVAVLLTTWFCPPPAGAETPVAAQQQRRAQESAMNGTAAPGGVPGTATEAGRLAEREQQSQHLRDFEGGRGGTIGITSLVIVLLLVIIILLII